jgi:hypothetical protein
MLMSGLKGLGFAMQGKLHHVEQRKTYVKAVSFLNGILHSSSIKMKAELKTLVLSSHLF